MSPNFCNPIRKVVDELLVTSTTASKNEKTPRDKSPKKRARGSKKGGRGALRRGTRREARETAL